VGREFLGKPWGLAKEGRRGKILFGHGREIITRAVAGFTPGLLPTVLSFITHPVA
jgi:hypothetical protein